MLTTITVWLLIATSNGYYNRGTVSVVGQFQTQQHCEEVRKHIPDDAKTSCVIATLVR